jgi:hypothetical protein
MYPRIYLVYISRYIDVRASCHILILMWPEEASVIVSYREIHMVRFFERAVPLLILLALVATASAPAARAKQG